jgi:hypothetical protein
MMSIQTHRICISVDFIIYETLDLVSLEIMPSRVELLLSISASNARPFPAIYRRLPRHQASVYRRGASQVCSIELPNTDAEMS